MDSKRIRPKFKSGIHDDGEDELALEARKPPTKKAKALTTKPVELPPKQFSTEVATAQKPLQRLDPPNEEEEFQKLMGAKIRRSNVDPWYNQYFSLLLFLPRSC